MSGRPKRIQKRNKFDPIKMLRQLIPAILVFAIWEVGSGSFIESFFFSKPSVIIVRLINFSEWNAYLHVKTTVTEMFWGYVIGASLGVVLGYVLGVARKLSAFIEPYILAFYAIPKVALAPLIIIWFGIGIWSKLFMAALMVFYLVFYNTHLGVRTVNQEMLNLARLMGASEQQIVRRIVFPFVSPYIMMGLRASVPRTVIGAILGEFVASKAGIGYYVLRATGNFDAAGQFVGVIVLLAFTLIFGGLLGLVERRILRWTKVS